MVFSLFVKRKEYVFETCILYSAYLKRFTVYSFYLTILLYNMLFNILLQFYFEAPSRNKQLRAGSFFLYQVFPGNTVTWQRLFIKSAREAEFETVEKMIAFFREDSSFINCKEPKSGNTALHWACRMGHFVSPFTLFSPDIDIVFISYIYA